jgi:ribose/xylose/arabinose/galactoside ABC-type transport system permease subunit
MGISIASKKSFTSKRLGIFLLDHAIEVILIVLVLVLALTVKNFMTWGNWMNILRANSLKGVMAFGMTMVIISGLIDLSIGSTVALSGVIVARCCRDLTAAGMDLTTACIIGIVLALLMAFAIGWFHGVSAHKGGMPPFIVTLVTQNALYGLAGYSQRWFPDSQCVPCVVQLPWWRPHSHSRHQQLRRYPRSRTRFVDCVRHRLLRDGIHDYRSFHLCHWR